MKIAIIERIEDYGEKEIPFNKRYYLDTYFREIFDELDILLIPVISEKRLDEICEICDGLIVTGSPNDVNPKYYGQKPINNDKEYKIDEFILVRKIVKLFSDANKPIFGICAGIQEINVIFGGTLNQKIPNHYLKDQSKHKVRLTEGSFLYDVYKEKWLEVNSYHKQSLKEIAPGFKITAMSEDGEIEAIEKDNIVAVQWHPEVLYDTKIFKAFIKKYFYL